MVRTYYCASNFVLNVWDKISPLGIFLIWWVRWLDKSVIPVYQW